MQNHWKPGIIIAGALALVAGCGAADGGDLASRSEALLSSSYVWTEFLEPDGDYVFNNTYPDQPVGQPFTVDVEVTLKDGPCEVGPGTLKTARLDGVVHVVYTPPEGKSSLPGYYSIANQPSNLKLQVGSPVVITTSKVICPAPGPARVHYAAWITAPECLAETKGLYRQINFNCVGPADESPPAEEHP